MGVWSSGTVAVPLRSLPNGSLWSLLLYGYSDSLRSMGFSMLELAAGACDVDLSAQVPSRRASSSEFLLLSSALNVCSGAVP